VSDEADRINGHKYLGKSLTRMRNTFMKEADKYTYFLENKGAGIVSPLHLYFEAFLYFIQIPSTSHLL
jgi:hypothetical protein